MCTLKNCLFDNIVNTHFRWQLFQRRWESRLTHAITTTPIIPGNVNSRFLHQRQSLHFYHQNLFYLKKPPNNYLTRFPVEFRVFYTFHCLTYNPPTHFHLAEIFPQGVCTWRHKSQMQLKRLRNNLLKNLGAVGGSYEKVISRMHNSDNWFSLHIFNLFKVLHIIAPWRNS